MKSKEEMERGELTEISYIPRAVNLDDLTPEQRAAWEAKEAAWQAEIEESDRRVREREQRREQMAKKGAEVWANAFLSGGEEAARKALEDHLREVEAEKTDQEREEERIIREREEKSQRELAKQKEVWDKAYQAGGKQVANKALVEYLNSRRRRTSPSEEQDETSGEPTT